MTRRIIQLFVGLFLYGVAIAMMVRANLGASPWDVLSQGTSRQTGLDFGLITVLISGVVLLFWIPIKQKLGIGTVLNALLIGPAASFGLWFITTPEQLWAQILLFAGGLSLLAVATGLYIGARFGPGPRDGLMTGIHARTGLPIWAARTAIEGTVLLIGWLLGGVVGFGTLAFALFIGPMVGVTMPLLRTPDAAPAPVSLAPVSPAATNPGAPASPPATTPARARFGAARIPKLQRNAETYAPQQTPAPGPTPTTEEVTS